jgi:hypothetical protein
MARVSRTIPRRETTREILTLVTVHSPPHVHRINPGWVSGAGRHRLSCGGRQFVRRDLEPDQGFAVVEIADQGAAGLGPARTQDLARRAG